MLSLCCLECPCLGPVSVHVCIEAQLPKIRCPPISTQSQPCGEREIVSEHFRSKECCTKDFSYWIKDDHDWRGDAQPISAAAASVIDSPTHGSCTDHVLMLRFLGSLGKRSTRTNIQMKQIRSFDACKVECCQLTCFSTPAAAEDDHTGAVSLRFCLLAAFLIFEHKSSFRFQSFSV